MHFRTPKNFREWLLLCSPALVIWAGTAISAAMPGNNTEGGLLGGLLGCFAAGLISLVAGFIFTVPNPKWAMRALWILIMAIAVAVVNFTVAFAGCALVIG